MNIWGATILSQTSLTNGVARYVVGPADWNASLPPGGTAGFGFEGRAAGNILAEVNAIGFGTALPTPPSVTIADAALAEGQAGTAELVFTLTLSAPSAEAVTILWSNGPNENGLWYDSNFSEADWINAWTSLAQRYDGNSTVIGMDLQNEPHAASWADWSAAAERAGNAIHAVNPDLLIIVEGVSQHQGEYYWWGGQLAGVREDPVVLHQANKLVYSPHDYPNSVWPQQWFQVNEFLENMPEVFREAWGFIYEEGLAPIYLGEFGSELIQPKDIAWMEKIVRYLNGDLNTDGVVDIPDTQEGMSFAYWSWNPNSSFTGGILMDDWATPHTHKLAAIEPLFG